MHVYHDVIQDPVVGHLVAARALSARHASRQRVGRDGPVVWIDLLDVLSHLGPPLLLVLPVLFGSFRSVVEHLGFAGDRPDDGVGAVPRHEVAPNGSS